MPADILPQKKCTKCHKDKLLPEFSNNKANKDGLQPTCKACKNAYAVKHRHTKYGLITGIYGSQRRSSRNRKHKTPNYTLLDLQEWVLAQPNFNSLYENWVNSGFDKMTIPSCDRIDDYLPYTLGNLQLVTWMQNKSKGHADSRNGVNNKHNKAVLQFSMEGILMAEYHSGRHASRVTGVNSGNLNLCCRGNAKTAGGFVWCFA